MTDNSINLPSDNKSYENRNDSTEFLLQEFDHISKSIIGNEEFGEKRVTFFTSLTTIVTGLFGFIDIINNKSVFFLFLAWIFLLLFGIMTLKRIIRRNISTDEHKDQLDKIRQYFLKKDKAILNYLSFRPTGYNQRKRKSIEIINLGNGGYTETVSLLNSIITGLILFVGISFINSEMIVINLIAGFFGFVISWIIQFWYVKWR